MFMKPIYIIVFFFLALFVFLKVNGPVSFFVNGVQTTKTDLFHAQGMGKVSGVPNTALLSFSVNKTALTVANAQDQTNRTVANIIDALKKLGIDAKDIKTTNYSVNPQYDNYNQNTIIGYGVSQDLELKVQPIDKANKAIDAATANGATNVYAGAYTFDDATLKQLQQKAREQAVQDAKAKAASLAQAAGIHLGRIVDVAEDNAYPQPIRYNTLMGAAKTADSQPTNITPGQNEITSNVTLSYEVY